MASRDDMVIKTRLRPKSATRVKEKAAEERRVEGARKQKRKSSAVIRRLRAARKAMGASMTVSRVPGKSKFATFAKSAAKKVGWAVAISEMAIGAGQVARAASGHSQRLIAAQDTDAQWFDLDEKARSQAEARGFVETDLWLLRIIAKEGYVNDQILSVSDDIKETAFTRAVGENLIEIDPAFDSRDTLQDQMIHIIKDKAAKANLKQKADEAMEMIKTWLLRSRSGR